MFLTCKKCTARFVVKASAIGEKGRRVRCAKCKHDWFQEPDLDELKAVQDGTLEDGSPAGVNPMPHGSNLPSLNFGQVSWALKGPFIASLVVFMIVLSVVNANSILPTLSGYYSMFGIYDSQGMVLYDVQIEKIDSDDYSDLLISGKIVNETDEEKHLPDLRVVVYGEDDEWLKDVTFDSEGKLVSGGQGIDFTNRIKRIPEGSTKVVLDLGNSIDLASR